MIDKKRNHIFHHGVTQAMFLSEYYQKDTHKVTAFLATQVIHPDKYDWKKLICLIIYLKLTKYITCIMRLNSINIVKLWVDASYAVHPGYKGHTREIMLLGKGDVTSMSRIQKLNTTITTGVEVLASHDVSVKLL